MKHFSRIISAILALAVMFAVLCSACAPNQSVAPAATPEPTATAVPTATPTAQPTLSLSMEQKAAMIWVGDHYRTYYPTDVFVFYGNIDGTDRLIWTSLENPETKENYSLIDSEYASELYAYDLFNHKYLFALNVPQDLLTNPQVKEFYKYIKDISPSLKNASFRASQGILKLSDLYKDNNINYDEIGNVYLLSYSYIYQDRGAIGPWNMEKAIEAFSAVTPSDYILPYWEFIPDTVMPPDFYALDSSVAAAEPTPMPELTFEQKKMLLGTDLASKFPEVQSTSVYYFIIRINRHNYRIFGLLFWDESSSELDVYNLMCEEYLFTIDLSEGNKISNIKYYEHIKRLSSSLSKLNAMVVKSGDLLWLAATCKREKIDYKDNETLNEFSRIMKEGSNEEKSALWDTFYSKDQIIDLYINSTPQEDMLPFWFCVPDAKIPEELKEFYPNAVTIPED